MILVRANFFDGIPQYIDPRAPQLYSIPGYDDGVVYPSYIGAASEVKDEITLIAGDYTDVLTGQKCFRAGSKTSHEIFLDDRCCRKLER